MNIQMQLQPYLPLFIFFISFLDYPRKLISMRIRPCSINDSLITAELALPESYVSKIIMLQTRFHLTLTVVVVGSADMSFGRNVIGLIPKVK